MREYGIQLRYKWSTTGSDVWHTMLDYNDREGTHTDHVIADVDTAIAEMVELQQWNSGRCAYRVVSREVSEWKPVLDVSG